MKEIYFSIVWFESTPYFNQNFFKIKELIDTAMIIEIIPKDSKFYVQCYSEHFFASDPLYYYDNFNMKEIVDQLIKLVKRVI